jgi:diacylglycerol kinase family enzyme
VNIRSIGPNLVFAPQADPGDGLLDVVLVPAEDKDKLSEYFQDEQEDNLSHPGLATHRGRHLQVQGEGTEFHLDDRPWPDPGAQASCRQPFSVEVRVIPQALVFLVPSSG